MKNFAFIALFLCLAPSAFADRSTRGALSAAIAREPEIIVAIMDGAGRFEVESTIEVDADGADEMVDIGSITKTVTAIATLHLLEEMGLSTQSNLAQLLPSVPADKALITLHQLLTHTSGIIESTGNDGEALSRSDFLDRVFAAPLVAEPGALYVYSNAGYSLLAAIIEIQSGQTYEDYILERVLPQAAPPIGYASVYREEQSILSGRSWLTGFRKRAIAEASWGGRKPGWNLVGNGGLVASAEGFLTLWAAFIAGDIVSDELVSAALTPHVDEGNGDTFYGYGLVVEPRIGGTPIYWHDGGNDIFSAEWRYDPSASLTFFSAGRGEAAFDAMAAMLGTQ